MSEWPKTTLEAYQTTDAEEFMVIPAEIGRELRDLIDRALRGDDPLVWNPEARRALARYEREVGNE